MEVKLLTSEQTIRDMVNFAAIAALTCRGNTDKETDPKELLLRIIKLGHESILEHIYFSYSIKGLSRACLQELARHRHISLSVESTRHTLRKNIENPEWCEEMLGSIEHPVFRASAQATKDLLLAIIKKDESCPNDELKYFIPEFWPTNLVLSTNLRELRHILKLRTAPNALMEFRKLGVELFSRVPDEFKYLLEDCVYIGG